VRIRLTRTPQARPTTVWSSINADQCTWQWEGSLRSAHNRHTHQRIRPLRWRIQRRGPSLRRTG